MKRIYAKEEVCIGCRLCEIHCIVQHSRSKRIIKVFKEEFPRPLSRVIVEEKGPLSFALQCRHCDEPFCVEACMTGAMYRDEEGRVMHDRDRCIGCWMCIMACPFGVIKRDEGKVASKCDLCPDLEVPVCVANCPNEALVYREVG
ncbi:MAG TPA: 4Fe-4S dicluster domain-containing protein [Candidatus Syntrophoarchaeum butanivorans]|uniref:4Fe-4S dicluster domain-containing protein n=1 Tax=Candidatus Syntropharchaeum butanivorans TaxID=1839936 RepID=A0A7J2S044_9EURY|nr:MAG: 4Fe-4S dicluster domain-containing protein [Candidatus Syntrophoarchaeum sp. WYZ-LMO15]HEC56737.1 4Fe-4S dicluster domain-containing protein [Candidatus Syntrophoarchaeum butanivorans]